MSGEFPHEWPQERPASIPPRFRHPDVMPVDYVTVSSAARMARLHLWRGFGWGLAAGLGLAVLSWTLPAFAQDTASWQGTGCQLVPVSGQAHVAEVHCYNVHTSGPRVNEGAMTAGDLTAHVIIDHQPGDIPDHFGITPPPGYIAEPPLLVIPEWGGAVSLILPWVGM